MNWITNYKSCLLSGDRLSDEKFRDMVYDAISETEWQKEDILKYLSLGIRKELHDEIVESGQDAVLQRYEAFNTDEEYCFLTDCRIQQEIDERYDI